MSEESTLLEENDVKVTNLRAVFATKTYAVSSINSVETKKIEPSGCVPGGAIITGIFMSIYGVTDVRELYVWLIVGVLLVIGGIWLTRTAKPSYAVQISTSSGEVKAYTSMDKTIIDRIVAALNDAIVKKG